jgi:hypothetical protein
MPGSFPPMVQSRASVDVKKSSVELICIFYIPLLIDLYLSEIESIPKLHILNQALTNSQSPCNHFMLKMRQKCFFVS